MRKRIAILFIGLTMLFVLSGCGKISNDVLTIKKYKGLDLEQVKKIAKESDAELEESIWEVLIQNCEVKVYPKDKVDEYTEELKSQYSAAASMYDVKEEQLIKEDYGISLDKLVQNRICKELAVELIAEKEEIAVTDKEYEEGLERYAKEYDYQDAEKFESFVGKDNLRNKLLQEEVTEFLLSHCK